MQQALTLYFSQVCASALRDFGALRLATPAYGSPQASPGHHVTYCGLCVRANRLTRIVIFGRGGMRSLGDDQNEV
jgi:hypothetical protein